MSDAVLSSVHYGLLGPLAATNDEGPVVLTGRQQRIVLTLLVLNANVPVSGDVLADRLWPDRPPASSAGSLRVLLSQLRRALDGPLAPGAESHLSRGDASGWVLHAAPDEIDADVFEAVVGDGHAAAGRGDLTAAVVEWRRALAMWRGPALAGVVDVLEDARAAAPRWEELRLVTLEHCVDAEIALGRHGALTPELEHLVAAHPFRESLIASLMLALYRSGRQTDALRVYGDARRRLVDELGIEPGRPLVELERAILRHETDLEAARAPSGSVVIPTVPEPSPPPPVPDAVASLAERSDLVGRERALAAWRGAWSATLEGRSQIVVVSGPAGIGKSRFAAAASMVASAEGATVLFGRCDEEALVAFQPVVEALRDHLGRGGAAIDGARLPHLPAELLQLLPELRAVAGASGGAGTAPDERYWLFEAVRGLLSAAAARTPLVVFVDDIQWADGPTLSLLRHLGRRLLDSRTVIVLTCRDTELTARDPVSGVLVDLEREARVTRIALTALGEVDALAVVDQVWPTDREHPPTAVLRQTAVLAEGNPFFLRQLTQHLADVDDGWQRDGPRVPHHVRALLERRLARLPDDAQRALAVAAVIGRDFHLPLLAAVLDEPEDRVLDLLDEALIANLVTDGDDDRFSFVHALLRETCYAQVSAGRRRRLHAAAGRALVGLGGRTSGTNAAIAHHFTLAGPDHRAEARAHSLLAAGEAMAVLAYEDAVALYERVLELTDEAAPAAERLDVLLALGRARTRVGDPPGSRRVLAEALDLARQAGAGIAFGEAALAYGGEWGIDRDLEDIEIPMLEEAVARVGDEQPVLRARLVARLASATFHLHGAADARSIVAQAVALADGCGDGGARTMAHHARHLVMLVDASPHDRLPVAELQLEAAHLAGSEGVNEALWNAAVDRIEMGPVGAVDRAIAAYVDQTERSRRPVDLWWTSVVESAVRAQRGDLDAAMAAAEHAFERGIELGQDDATRVLAGQLFMVRWLQGRAGELRDATRDFVAAEPEIVAWRCALGLIDAETGDVLAARDGLAGVAAETLAAVPTDSLWAGTLLLAGEAVAAAQAADLVPAVEDVLRPLAGRHVALGQGFAVLGPVDRVLGQLAAARGDLDGALDHLERAIALAEEAGSRPYRLLATVAAADVRARRGEEAAAASLLDAACAEARRAGIGLVEQRAATAAGRS